MKYFSHSAFAGLHNLSLGETVKDKSCAGQVNTPFGKSIVAVKVGNSATIRSDDSTGDSSGESGSDPESTESTPESNQSILDRRSLLKGLNLT